VGSIYKIISKVLANRLKGVLGKLISKNRTTFVQGKQLEDGVVVVNEIIDLAKRRKDKCLLLKVDFERAYDSVKWEYLGFMLQKRVLQLNGSDGCGLACFQVLCQSW